MQMSKQCEPLKLGGIYEYLPRDGEPGHTFIVMYVGAYTYYVRWLGRSKADKVLIGSHVHQRSFESVIRQVTYAEMQNKMRKQYEKYEVG